ncbi:MAG: hypothetical protein NTZ39_11650 [Methanoregula sp.]|nr:hypothetical protein [Methanoregula sp.]
MIGQTVRVSSLFQFLNRHQILVADCSGEISVKRFTASTDNVNKEDLVEIPGMAIRRYMFVSDPNVNCVAIRKIDKIIVPFSAARGKSG